LTGLLCGFILSLAAKGDDIETCYQEKAKKDAKKLK